MVIDDSGKEIRRHALGDLGKGIALERADDAILLRAGDGAAAFSSAGALMWQRRVQSPQSLDVVSYGYVPLIRTTPWKKYRDVETKYFGGQLFWVPSHGQVMVIPTRDSRIIGLRVRDGETAWELPIGAELAIEHGYIVTVHEGTAEVHKISS